MGGGQAQAFRVRQTAAIHNLLIWAEARGNSETFFGSGDH
jgi:hypothetical protein